MAESGSEIKAQCERSLNGQCEYRLRPASSERDMEQILKLIKELSAYNSPIGEKSVTNTVKTLVRDGLGKEKFFHCLLVEVDRAGSSDAECVGYALYFFTYSTWEGRELYLEDLYIQPPWQRRGIGSGVMRRLAQIAREYDCARFKWQGLSGADNVAFYTHLRAESSSEWLNYKLDRDGIQRLAES